MLQKKLPSLAIIALLFTLSLTITTETTKDQLLTMISAPQIIQDQLATQESALLSTFSITASCKQN